MTNPPTWYAVFTAKDDEQSRQALGEYLRRENRPSLSVGQLVDVLLLWSTESSPVPMDLAIEVLTAAFDQPTFEVCDELERQIVSDLSERILGWSVSLPAAVANGHRSESRVLSRAAAAGMYRAIAARQPLASAARGACVALHSCRYVEAAQALSIVCAHNAQGDGPVPAVLIRFIEQGFAHLNALAAVHGSAALAWELRLAEATYEGVLACPR